MKTDPVPNKVPYSAESSVYQPGFASRMQHSKALVAIVAVLGVTVMALAAALMVNRSEAQTGLVAPTPLLFVSSTTPTTPVPVTRLVSEKPKAWLRVDDGSRRNMEVSSAIPVGSKVVVEGKNLRMANTAG